ncbi:MULTISPECIES: transporter substrate-binding domain-containing protein [Variovorax]|jgi:polar amino acid transport system substrate-binding protein|uniref:transporter substrate-binding domain-containing protein n=1 Tax=Variovorax TaxID=34072 RepID=UPI000B142838|nr:MULTISPECIES: transporter substrate-binding domain-containing protein [Variovorax]MBN8755538.1 transporter substrate-binding domain-containing protein [Variovorax sp.]UKI07540.1 transporter substrate-binding domain-containing protein [Variovorax paradoxus]
MTPRIFLPLLPMLFLAAGTGAHADATLDKIKQRGKLTVGVILSGPPFGTIDPATQKPVGYNVELAEGVAKGLGVGLETVQVQPSNRVQFLQQGKVDILIANMQWTQERSEILSFVPTPFEEVGGAAIARKDSGLAKWEDLRGKPVCVSQGSNFTKPLAEQYGAQIKAFRGQPESLLALKGGNCVAAVHVSPTLRELVTGNADWKDYAIVSPSDLIPSPSVIWVRKGEADTQAAIDRIVQNWHRTGWLIEVEKKNGMTPTPLLHELKAKFAKAPL